MILLIDNYDSFTYNLYQLIASLGVGVKVVRNDEVTIAEIEELQPDGIVISPGPGIPEEAGICVELIREFSGRIPLLGVCLGHQAIGVAFGGIVSGAGEIIHGKSSRIFHNRSALYSGLALPFEAGRYHSLVIQKDRFPPELLIEAENAGGIIMGIRHREHDTFGVQFHPESILTPQGHLILKNFLVTVGATADA
jgi:anthranilate synthase component II